ncbi:DUF6894 family protein [Methylobacterium indicum]|nr:hypothetical protein [Methylobacterium indicum]
MRRIAAGVAMTVYYFHVQKGRRLILDPEGVDLRGPADALEMAAKLASGLLDDGEITCDWTHSAVRVEDQHHRRILRLPLTSVRARDSRSRTFVN